MAFAFVAAASYYSNSDASPACNKPTGAAEGNLLVAIIQREDIYLAGPTAIPSGWTAIGPMDDGSGYCWWAGYKIAGGSEPGSYEWTYAGAKPCVVSIGAYADIPNVSVPVDTSSNTLYDTYNTTVRAAGVTIDHDDTPVLFVAAVYVDTGGFTTPSGWAEDYDDYDAVNTHYGVTFASKVLASGATGNIDATAAEAPNAKHAYLIALGLRIRELSFAGTLGAITSAFTLKNIFTFSLAGTLGAIESSAILWENGVRIGGTLGAITSSFTIATVAGGFRLLDGAAPEISTLDVRNKVYVIVKDSSPLVVGSATNTTIAPTYANSPREMVMFVDSGDATYCGNVATAQLAFVQTEKTRLTGLRVSLRYGLAIERGTLLQVVIPRAGINGNYPVRRLEHDFASGETTIDVGEYAAPRDDPEALIAIAQALAALVKETSI